MANNRFALELIPPSLLLEIEKYLSPIDVLILVMACKATLEMAKNLDQDGAHERQSLDFFYVNVNFRRPDFNYRDSKLDLFFNSRINNAMYNILKQTGFYILTGRKDIALEMIDDRLLLGVVPKIRLKKNSLHIEEHGGCTLYQLALRTGDHEIYGPLGKRVEEKFGHEVKVQQDNEAFPERKNYRPLFDALIKTIAADLTIDFVDNSWNVMNDTTLEALQALESSLASDVYFDPQIIMDFVDAYEEGQHAFKDKEKKWKQHDLYWRCGFGILEKFMPYYIAMALNEQDDFWGVMEGKKPVTRSTLRRDRCDFFDLSLGVSHWTINGGRAPVRGLYYRPVLKNFVRYSQKNLENNLSSHCSNQQSFPSQK